MPRDMERRRQWHAQWMKTYRAKATANGRASRQEIRAFLVQQKMDKCCMRCGNSDYRVLDFHHRDSAVKTAGLSTAYSRTWSRKRILEEIAKCDVLCANCHRILHWDERQTAMGDD